MRLQPTAHMSQPWRIHEIAPEFRLEDVWEVPGIGGIDDFRRLVRLVVSLDLSRASSPAVRLPVIVREKLGQLLALDGPGSGVGARVPTLQDRLPADLVGTAAAARFDALAFKPLYLTDDEFAAEAANRTVHGVLHLGRVPDESGGFRVQLAVLVNPNGMLGTAYMVAIKPFRYLLVYPSMLREIGHQWEQARTASPEEASA